MNPIPLIVSVAMFCFSLTGPVSWPVTAFAGVAMGWSAGLYYAAYKIDHQ